MIIGQPKELKDGETRIMMLPSLARELVDAGHTVLVETGTGLGSNATDQDYLDAGAKIVETASEIYEQSDFIVKFKDLTPSEKKDIHLHEGQIFYCAFHLGEGEKDWAVFDLLKNSKVKALASELLVNDAGKRPVVVPQSEIAGSLAPLLAAHYIHKNYGGSGVHLVGMAGCKKPKITILGGGVAGYAAAKVCRGFDADVTVFEIDNDRIAYLRDMLPGMNIQRFKIPEVRKRCVESDAFINTIYPDATLLEEAIIRREEVKAMRDGSVIVDLSGCNIIETNIKYTTIPDPYFIEEGVVHITVDYMPGMVPATASDLLDEFGRQYILDIANKGLRRAAEESSTIRRSISFVNGKCVHPDIAATHGVACEPYADEELD